MVDSVCGFLPESVSLRPCILSPHSNIFPLSRKITSNASQACEFWKTKRDR